MGSEGEKPERERERYRREGGLLIWSREGRSEGRKGSMILGGEWRGGTREGKT